ncbi:hypothetical protein M0D69_29410 [Caballeronia sp. SEWSISQ10-4 2]|uniref:hypothetical protein n=1 Tax=Caballeronia sp. SEWSISQ10-4 2 TaxID=2937438 RepID=UPI0026548DAD|nr:hypothetical protein [Caballeronia sp. SEWSISQ10-4 2]MDN7182058.1 hypothetical protein [Caballeronia sp. SEWSISQ10-4 2]
MKRYLCATPKRKPPKLRAALNPLNINLPPSRRIVRFSATFRRRSTIAILRYAVTAENAASIGTSGFTGITIRETQNGAGE